VEHEALVRFLQGFGVLSQRRFCLLALGNVSVAVNLGYIPDYSVGYPFRQQGSTRPLQAPIGTILTAAAILELNRRNACGEFVQLGKGRGSIVGMNQIHDRRGDEFCDRVP
jgi:hypothetical protein